MASKPDPEQPEKETVINHPAGSEEPQQIPILELNPEDEKDVKEWLEIASKITIMVTAWRNWSWKINSFECAFGHPVFEIGLSKKQAVTTRVTERMCKKDDIEIVAVDCPGLHDGTDNEYSYVSTGNV